MVHKQDEDAHQSGAHRVVGREVDDHKSDDGKPGHHKPDVVAGLPKRVNHNRENENESSDSKFEARLKEVVVSQEERDRRVRKERSDPLERTGAGAPRRIEILSEEVAPLKKQFAAIIEARELIPLRRCEPSSADDHGPRPQLRFTPRENEHRRRNYSPGGSSADVKTKDRENTSDDFVEPILRK